MKHLTKKSVLPCIILAGLGITACWVGTVDLNGSWRELGGSAGGCFGYSVARFQADANFRADIAIGAPTEDAVYIYTEPHWGLSREIGLGMAAKFTGEAGGEAGWAVERAHLVGSVLTDDLIISAPSENGGRGRLYILDGWSVDSDTIGPEDAATTIEGLAMGEFLGWDVAVGDVNGDGRQDLIAGAPGFGPVFSPGKGRVYAFFGPLPAGTIDVGDADITLNGDDFYGVTVAAADLDQSGTDEIIATSLWGGQGDGLPTGHGRVYVTYDPAAGEATVEEVSTVLWGQYSGQNFGFALSTGDVNGDGIEDLIASAPAYYCAMYDEHPGIVGGSGCAGLDPGGSVHVLLGDPVRWSSGLFHSDAQVLGTTPLGLLGVSIDARGDVNNDGINDILIGSLSGKAYMFYGDAIIGGGISRNDTAGHARFGGVGGYPGRAVLNDGLDLSGDGVAEIVITAPERRLYEDPAPASPSHAYIMKGIPSAS